MIADQAAGPYEQVLAAQLSAAVRAAVGDLPARDQQALTAMLSGEALHPGETPRKRRFRALERLRTVWRKHQQRQDPRLALVRVELLADRSERGREVAELRLRGRRAVAAAGHRSGARVPSLVASDQR